MIEFSFLRKFPLLTKDERFIAIDNSTLTKRPIRKKGHYHYTYSIDNKQPSPSSKRLLLHNNVCLPRELKVEMESQSSKNYEKL